MMHFLKDSIKIKSPSNILQIIYMVTKHFFLGLLTKEHEQGNLGVSSTHSDHLAGSEYEYAHVKLTILISSI